MTQLTQFPRYSQKENWATNHTLLLMRRLYEFNQPKFRRFLQELLKELDDEFTDIASHLGIFFAQQIGERMSIPDGVFMQESVKVIVETKTGTSFDFDQINRHLDGLKKVEHGLLILLSPTVEQSLNENRTPDNKPLLSTTFSDVIRCARGCLADHDEEMVSVVNDFEGFCSEEGLLPRDDSTLMVVPCGQSRYVNLHNHLYYCPSTRTHRNARYLGIYADKSIRGIGEIKKRVECTVNLKAERVTADGFLEQTEKQRILDTVRKAQDYGHTIEDGRKFYICDEIVPTDFKKKSKGGLQNRQYLDLGRYFGDGGLPRVEEIANQLKNKTWP